MIAVAPGGWKSGNNTTSKPRGVSGSATRSRIDRLGGRAGRGPISEPPERRVLLCDCTARSRETRRPTRADRGQQNLVCFTLSVSRAGSGSGASLGPLSAAGRPRPPALDPAISTLYPPPPPDGPPFTPPPTSRRWRVLRRAERGYPHGPRLRGDAVPTVAQLEHFDYLPCGM